MHSPSVLAGKAHGTPSLGEEERPLPSSSPYRPPEQEQAAHPPDRLAKQRGSPAQARPPRRSRDSAGEILSTEAAARAAEGKSPAEVVLGDDDDNDTLRAKVLALKDQLRLSQVRSPHLLGKRSHRSVRERWRWARRWRNC